MSEIKNCGLDQYGVDPSNKSNLEQLALKELTRLHIVDTFYTKTGADTKIVGRVIRSVARSPQWVLRPSPWCGVQGEEYLPLSVNFACNIPQPVCYGYSCQGGCIPLPCVHHCTKHTETYYSIAELTTASTNLFSWFALLTSRTLQHHYIYRVQKKRTPLKNALYHKRLIILLRNFSTLIHTSGLYIPCAFYKTVLLCIHCEPKKNILKVHIHWNISL